MTRRVVLSIISSELIP